MAEIRLEAVVKQYHGTAAPALAGVTQTVDDGELFVLLGPSGCGKSTLLKLIAGLEEPSAGEIYLDSSLMNYVEPGKRNVAMVFQDYALYPHMTVEENVGFPLRMQKQSRKASRGAVDRALFSLGLVALRHRRIDALSGGQRQRVAVARALVRRPAVLLMDEPLSNLDALLRHQTREELRRLHGEVGGTIVYVTHDQVEATTLGDRIAVMDEGEMVQVGSAEDLYFRPATRFVAGFVGVPPMAFLEGRVEAGRFVAPGFTLRLPDHVQRSVSPTARLEHCALGVRAENVRFGTTSSGDAPPWTCELLEAVGGDRLARSRLGDLVLRGMVDRGAELSQGQRVWPIIDHEAVHLFLPSGANAISAGVVDVAKRGLTENEQVVERRAVGTRRLARLFDHPER